MCCVAIGHIDGMPVVGVSDGRWGKAFDLSTCLFGGVSECRNESVCVCVCVCECVCVFPRVNDFALLCVPGLLLVCFQPQPSMRFFVDDGATLRMSHRLRNPDEKPPYSWRAGCPNTALRRDIHVCPDWGGRGVARRLAGLPAAADAVMRLLSQQKWDDGEVTERSPPRNKSGCVEVQKVYFRCGGGPRQSFTSPTTFNKFLDCVNALEPDTTVDLLLWDDNMSSAPSTLEKGAMNCLCIFLVLVVHASRCACFSGCMLPCNCLMCLSLLRTGHSHTCTCIHWRSPNSSMPTGLCVSHHRSCLTGAGRRGAGGGAGAAAGRLTDGSSVHESCKNGFETLMPATYLLRASARTQPSSNTCVTDYTLGAPHCLANLHASTWRPTHLHATHHVHVAHVRFWMFDCKHNIILPPEERLASVRADLRAPEQRQLLQVFHTDNVEEVFHVVLQCNSEPLLVDGQPVVATDVTARRPDILVDAL